MCWLLFCHPLIPQVLFMQVAAPFVLWSSPPNNPGVSVLPGLPSCLLPSSLSMNCPTAYFLLHLGLSETPVRSSQLSRDFLSSLHEQKSPHILLGPINCFFSFWFTSASSLSSWDFAHPTRQKPLLSLCWLKMLLVRLGCFMHTPLCRHGPLTGQVSETRRNRKI